MKKPLILVAGLALATISGAQKGAPSILLETSVSGPVATTTNSVPATIISQTESAGATTLVVDISGTDSWDALNDPSNTTLLVPLGAGASMTGIGWDTTLTTFGGSWLSEARFYFDGSDLDLSGLFLSPGAGSGFPGTGVFFSSGGTIDLSDNAIPDIPILADGDLHIQLNESFDDADDVIDATWVGPSTLTIVYEGGGAAVPTVGEWGMIFLGVALLGGVVFVTMRKRKPVTA
jgi:hypothetical protein